MSAITQRHLMPTFSLRSERAFTVSVRVFTCWRVGG